MAGSNSIPANVVKQIDEVSSSSNGSYCNSDTETPSSIKFWVYTMWLSNKST